MEEFDGGVSPHHESVRLALRSDAPLGIPALLRRALADPFAARGLTLGDIRVHDAPTRHPGRQDVAVRLVAQVDTDHEMADLIIDVPYVSRMGAIVHKERDIAPIAFLRAAPGTWSIGAADDDPEDLVRAGSAVSGLDELLDAWPELSAWFASEVDSPVRHSILHVPEVLDPVRVMREDGIARRIAVPGGSGVAAPLVVAALDLLARRESDPDHATLADVRREVGQGPLRMASHLRRIADHDPAFSPRLFAAGEMVVAGDRTLPDEISLLEDLDNCRLLLAGHHLALAVDRGAREAVRSLPASVEPGWLGTVIHKVAGVINLELDRVLLGARRHPDGGSAPFEAIDDTNPLSRFEHCRKVSRLGPGGVALKSRVAMALRDIHPSQHGRLCPFNTPESDRVGLVRHLTLDALVRPDGTFVESSRSLEEIPRRALLSASALLLPLLDHDDAVRGVLAAKSVRQFVPLVEPEVPLVATGDESLVSARLALSVSAQGGRIAVTDDGVLVERDRLGTLLSELPLRTHPGSVPSAGTDDSRILVRPASNDGTVRPGELILRHPGTAVRGGEVVLAPGANARCVVMPFRGLTIEDAVVVSESFAHRMRSFHLERVVEVLAPDELTSVNPARLRGTVVEVGQDLFQVVSTRGSEPAAVASEEAAELSNLDPADLVRRAVVSPFAGEVVEVRRVRRSSGESEVQILVRVERALAKGDKVTARHGNKGVVADVLPDAAMPVIEAFAGPGAPDETAELVISPVGPLRRMVIGLLHELAWGRVASAGGELPPLPAVGHQGIEAISLAITGDGGPGWTASVRLPDGRRLDSVAVGTSYLIKLNHLADRKLQAQNWTFASAATGQPAPIRVDEGGRHLGRPGRLGEMEHWALQAYGADALLRDADGARRGSTGAMPSSLWALLDNLHAGGLVATVTFGAGDDEQVVEDSRDYVALLQASNRAGARLTSITFDVAERRRLRAARAAGVTVPDGYAPDTLITLEDVYAAAKASRERARHATPRAEDVRSKRNETPTLRQVLDGEGWITERSELACRCGRTASTDGGPRSGVCRTCRRMRRRMPGLQEAHHVAHLELRTPVVHPWLVTEFWMAARVLAKTDAITLDSLRSIAPDHTGAGPPSVRRIEAGPDDELALIDRCVALLEDSDTSDDTAAAALGVLEWTLSYLPVLPPAHRKAVSSDGASVPHKLATRYRAVAAAASAADRDIESYARLRRAVADVLGEATGDPGEATVADRLRFKEGLLRRYLLGGRAWSTAYSLIVPGLDLLMDQVGLPEPVMRELELSEGDLVLINRSPTLLRTGLLGMRVRSATGSSVELPPAVLPMLAGDFDGDMVSVHRPVLPEAREELRTLLHPAASLRSPADGELLVYLGEELRIDPARTTQLADLARGVHGAFLSGEDGALDRAEVALRDGYLVAYEALTGRASVSLGHLIDRELDPGVLAEIRSAGFGDALLGQCVIGLDPVDTYATRRGVEGSAEIDGCFMDGLSRSGIIANARGAMARLGDKKLATPFAGDFTKVLVEALYSVTVVEGDCGTAERVALPALSVRADRRAEGDTVRSPLACSLLRSNATSVCAACYGDDVSSGHPARTGARVGVLAATAIGERGTQLALKSIHVGARQTQLDKLRQALVSPEPVEVPRQDENGVLHLDEHAPRLATLREDPLALVQLLRWFLTPADARSKPRAASGVDDIHLELAVASLAAGVGPRRSPLGAALARHDLLGRASSRGQLAPLLTALRFEPERRTASVADPRSAVILAPGMVR